MSATRVSRYPSRSKTRRAAASSSSRVRTPLAVTRSSCPARRAAAVPAGVQPPRVRGAVDVRPRFARAWPSRCDRPGGLYFDIDVEYNRRRGPPRVGRRGGMTFTFTEEQEELRRTVRRFLEHTSPPSQARRLMETAEGYDPGVWTRMATEVGLQGLTIPEEYGGAGFGPVERLI